VTRQPEDRWWRAEVAPERKVRLRLKLAGVIVALAILAFGCALGSRDPNLRTFDPADADNPRHFMVLPVNLTIKTPSEFTPVLNDMFGAIAGYIRDRGDTLETISWKEATAQWAESIIEVKESEAMENNFETAMRVYVAHLGETRSFDAVIVPSIVYRNTKTRDRTVKWDGVFRKMKVINLSKEAKNKGLARALSVAISGVSFHVMVFSVDGDLIFQKYGGLDLAHDVDMAGAEFTMNPRLSLKENPLKESDHLSEGIGVAFDPYLPRP
jgi:hypothetical protein